MTELADVFADLDAPGSQRPTPFAPRHPILVIALCTVLCGARPVPIRLPTAKLRPTFQSSPGDCTVARN